MVHEYVEEVYATLAGSSSILSDNGTELKNIIYKIDSQFEAEHKTYSLHTIHNQTEELKAFATFQGMYVKNCFKIT